MYISKPTCLAFFAILPLVVACGDGAADQPPATHSGGSAGAGQAGTTAMAGSAGSAGATANGGAGGAGGSSVAGGGAGGAAAGSAGAGGQGGAAAGSGGAGGAAGGASGGGGAGGEAPMPFVLASPDLDRHDDCTNNNKGPCDTFPTKNILQTIGGQNQSPELSWGTGPAGTMSYAIALFDTSFNNNPHWVVWNLPATTHSLPADLQHKAMLDTPQGAQQASFQPDNAYAGPGAHGNVYEFKVYALKVAKINVNDAGNEGAIRQQLEQSPDVLGTSSLRAKSP